MTQTLEEFRAAARRWLHERLPPRTARSDTAWGEGPDSVAVFHDLSPQEERALDTAAREWHRTKLDAGYAALTWPERFGGRDLPSAYERAFAEEEARFTAPPEHEAFTATLHLMAPTLSVFGTQEQQNTFIPRLRLSRALWDLRWRSPPDACRLVGVGRSAKNIRTRRGDHHRVEQEGTCCQARRAR